jgi:general secretion pathway protein G
MFRGWTVGILGIAVCVAAVKAMWSSRTAVWAFVLLVLALVVPSLFRPGPRPTPVAKVSHAKIQLADFKRALDLYTGDYGKPPSNNDGLAALLGPQLPTRRYPYLPDVSAIPKDPWGRAYRYSSPGERGELYIVETYGADGEPGGGGVNADLSVSATARQTSQLGQPTGVLSERQSALR